MLHPGDWATFFDFDSNGEIVAVDIEGDVHVLWMQIRTRGVVKAFDFDNRQNEAANGDGITGSAFKPVTKVDGA